MRDDRTLPRIGHAAGRQSRFRLVSMPHDNYGSRKRWGRATLGI